MIKKIVVDVECLTQVNHSYGQTVEISTTAAIWEQLLLRTPCCGYCGSRDIRLAVRVKDTKED